MLTQYSTKPKLPNTKAPKHVYISLENCWVFIIFADGDFQELLLFKRGFISAVVPRHLVSLDDVIIQRGFMSHSLYISFTKSNVLWMLWLFTLSLFSTSGYSICIFKCIYKCCKQFDVWLTLNETKTLVSYFLVYKQICYQHAQVMYFCLINYIESICSDQPRQQLSDNGI